MTQEYTPFDRCLSNAEMDGLEGKRFEYALDYATTVLGRPLNAVEMTELEATWERGMADGMKPKSSAEIGRESRRLMFGENEEAFPSQEVWNHIVN